MANMFFAGIPTEGSGSRPLDADLYGAEQQGAEQENLSATGNLNIGNVIRYDEHAQRYMDGGAMTEESAMRNLPRLGTPMSMAETDASSRNIQYGDNNSTMMQTTSLSNPAIAGSQAGGASARSIAGQEQASSAALSEAPQDETQTPSDQTSSSSSETTTTTTTDSYNTTTTTTTTNNYNETNYYYEGDTIGGGSVDGDDLTNVVETLVDAPSDLLTTTLNVANDLLDRESGATSIIGDTLHQVTELLGSSGSNELIEFITNTTADTFSNVTNILHEAGGDKLVETVLSTMGDTVSSVTDILSGGGDNLLENVMSTVEDGLTTMSEILNDAGGNELLSMVVNATSGGIESITNVLEGSVGENDLLSAIVSTVGDTLINVTDVFEQGINGDTLNQTLEAVESGLENVTSLLGDAGGEDLLSQVLAIAEEGLSQTADQLTDIVNGDISSTIETLTENPAEITTLLQPALEMAANEVNLLSDALPVETGIGEITEDVPDNIIELTTLAEPALEAVGDLLTPVADELLNANDGNPLLDANVTGLSDGLQAADDSALINADLNLLSNTNESPEAEDAGLVNLDASLFSTPDDASIADGIDASVNLNTLTDPLLGVDDIPIIDIEVPTPTLVEVAPEIPPLLEEVTSATDALAESVSNVIDPEITLAALTDTSGLIAAVDSGILFTGSSTQVGSEPAAAPPPAPDISVGTLLHGFFGH